MRTATQDRYRKPGEPTATGRARRPASHPRDRAQITPICMPVPCQKPNPTAAPNGGSGASSAPEAVTERDRSVDRLRGEQSAPCRIWVDGRCGGAAPGGPVTASFCVLRERRGRTAPPSGEGGCRGRWAAASSVAFLEVGHECVLTWPDSLVWAALGSVPSEAWPGAALFAAVLAGSGSRIQLSSHAAAAISRSASR